MYREYRFEDEIKAGRKKQQLEKQYGYKFPVYGIQIGETKYLSIVYPNGLMPNPKKKSPIS